MAVEVQIDCRGVTLRQYDEAMEIGGFLPGGPLPPDGLFHYVKKVGRRHSCGQCVGVRGRIR